MSKTLRSRYLGICAMVICSNTLHPALASSMGAAITASPLAPEEFLQQLHMIDDAEMSMGALAQRRGQTPMVRDFGKILVDDYGRLDAELVKALAGGGGGSAVAGKPRALEHSGNLKAVQARLEKVSDAAFDREFLKAMIQGHEDAIALVTEAKNTLGGSFRAQSIAADALPVLKKHRDMAKATLEQLGYHAQD